MPFLRRQKDLKRLNLNGACYLCGEMIVPTEKPSPDHVVNKSLFHVDHREPLLILPTHQHCNHDKSQYDEEIGQLAGLLWRDADDSRRRSSKLGKRTGILGTPEKPLSGVLDGFPLWAITRLWIQGFHAALYKEFLEPPGAFVLSGPIAGTNDLDAEPEIPSWHREVVATIKRNAQHSRIDGLELGSGHFRYWCVWRQAEEAGHCYFGIDAYGWSSLGGTLGLPRHSCVGMYSHRVPKKAAKEIAILVPSTNNTPFDLFAD